MKDRTIKEALQRASFCLQKACIDQPRKEAEYLLALIMKTDRLKLFLSQDKIITPELESLFQDAVERRCCQEPFAYIAGEKYFYGKRFIINRDVLIPRPETELIIDCALEWHEWLKTKYDQPIKCVDLGTGSGALAVTLALLLPDSLLWASDLSGASLKVARLNAKKHGVATRIQFLQGDYFDAFDCTELKPRLHLIVSNPPYLGEKELATLPRGVKDYEPVVALDGGYDGLDGYRSILSRIGEFVKDPAVLLMEVGATQKEEVETLCFNTGLFKSLQWRIDLNGWPRVVEGLIS